MSFFLRFYLLDQLFQKAELHQTIQRNEPRITANADANEQGKNLFDANILPGFTIMIFEISIRHFYTANISY